MLVVEVDIVGAQLFQAALYAFPNGLRLAVQPQGAVRIVGHPHLGGDDHLVLHVSEGLAHQLLIVGDAAVWIDAGVGLSRVKEIVPQVHGLPQGAHRRLPVSGGAVGVAEAHAAQAHRVDRQAACSQCSLIHGVVLHSRLKLCF